MYIVEKVFIVQLMYLDLMSVICSLDVPGPFLR